MADDLDDWPDGDPDESDVVTCPNCGAEVYEDAEQCPACGEWITRSTHPLSGRSWWFVALGLVGVAATIASLALLGSW
jgi:hypothetical protein